MKPGPRLAYLIIFLFLFSFNALQVYLVMERISEAKSRFSFAYTSALGAALGEYHNLKAIDSTAIPNHAWVVYSAKQMRLWRVDSQTISLTAPFSTLVTDSVEPAAIELIVNAPAFRKIDMPLLENLFRKSLRTNRVNSDFHLDTLTINDRKRIREKLLVLWENKRNRAYPYATTPMRFPYNSNSFVYAEVKTDRSFFRRELLLPLLALAAILLIGNAALLVVYKTIRKQKRINELKTDFINNITHEMKTPITIATAGLEALEHHVPSTERTDFYLHTTKKKLHLLNDFVERILDAAVRDVSDFTLKKERTDLHLLFQELIEGRSVLPGKPVNFSLNADGPVIMQGDRLHLETAFHNIIDNAIKYSGQSVDIVIALTQNNRECIIKISDNGIGIPPQYMKNIFEKFFRVPQGDAQPVNGFGLGLYYVKSILLKHSGTINVHSKLNTGTEFTITLPNNP